MTNTDKLVNKFHAQCRTTFKDLIKVLMDGADIKDENARQGAEYMIQESGLLDIYKHQLTVLFTEEDIESIVAFNESGLGEKVDALSTLMEVKSKEAVQKVDEVTLGNIILGEE